jgi:hypothetical protein
MTPSILFWFCLGVTVQPAGGDKPPKVEKLRPERGWKTLSRANLWFDPKGKRVILRARVVLREGVLEHLMCLKGTKEHEAIVATEAPPRVIHTALLLTGADVGHPVQFVPEFAPPAGTPIAIEFHWYEHGKLKKADAREWVWDAKAKAPLKTDWVFAGSIVYEDRVTKKPAYAADEGDLITVANFASAILDLPISSSANDADRGFTTNTAKIPPVGTEVFVFLTPRPPNPAAKTRKAANAGP